MQVFSKIAACAVNTNNVFNKEIMQLCKEKSNKFSLIVLSVWNVQ